MFVLSADTLLELQVSGSQRWAHLTALNMEWWALTDNSEGSLKGFSCALLHYTERRKIMLAILDTPNQIEQFRLHVLFRGLKLELMGMKMSRGASCYKTLKSMGFTGTKQQVYTALAEVLDRSPESV